MERVETGSDTYTYMCIIMCRGCLPLSTHKCLPFSGKRILNLFPRSLHLRVPLQRVKRSAARRMFGAVGCLRAPAAGMAGPAQVAFQLMLLEGGFPIAQEGWGKKFAQFIQLIQSNLQPHRQEEK